MSDDLVQRLREGELSKRSWRVLLDEAADHIELLKTALQFYADINHYQYPDTETEIESDGGDRARRALEGKP